MSGENAIALVVGGSRGVGRCVARRFRDDGLSVRVVSRNAPEEPGDHAGHWSADLGAADCADVIVQRVQEEKLRVGRLVFCQRYRGNDADWQGRFQTEIASSYSIIQRLSEGRLFSSPDAAIVFVSSVAGISVVTSQGVYYHLIKGAVRQMVAKLAVDLGPAGIRVNAVCASTFVKPESRDHYARNRATPDFYAKHAPLRRMPAAEDVADAVAFLAGITGRFLTGQTLVVDGGLSLIYQEFPLNHGPG